MYRYHRGGMAKRIRNVVVGVATVHRPDPVLGGALRLAERLGATLHVVHAFLLADPLLDAYARLGYLGSRTLEGYGVELANALDLQIARLGSTAQVRTHVLAGSPAALLVETAQRVDADLIVTGGTRRGAIARTLLGTTAQQVLRGSRTPVLMMRGTLDRLERVLLTTDISASSTVVLDEGVAIAAAIAGERLPHFEVLFVAPDTLAPVTIQAEVMRQVASREFRTFLAERPLPGGTGSRLRTGDPAREIVAAADEWEADLVVLGTHGRRGAVRFLLGSVAETALRTTDRSVLVIPSSAPLRTEAPVGEGVGELMSLI